jgi:integrase
MFDKTRHFRLIDLSWASLRIRVIIMKDIKKRQSSPFLGVALHKATGKYFGRKIVTYADGLEKRLVTPYFATDKEAYDALQIMVDEAERVTDETICLGDLCARYIDAIITGKENTKTKAHTTVEVSRTSLRMLLPDGYYIPYKNRDFVKLRDIRARKLRPKDLNRLIDTLNAQSFSHGYNGKAAVQSTYIHLRRVWQWAAKRQIVDIMKSPFIMVDPPEYQAPDKKEQAPKDVAALLQAIREYPSTYRGTLCANQWTKNIRKKSSTLRNYGMVKAGLMLKFTTGARIGEIRGLRWNNVDLEAGSVYFCEQTNETSDHLVPKTRESKRKLHVIPEVVELLRDLPRDGEFVFWFRRGHPTSHTNFDRHFQAIIKHFKLEHMEMTLHTVRSISATHLSSRVTRSVLNATLGWSQDSKMPGTYIVANEEARNMARDATQAVIDQLDTL